jgi:hypothetical protein
MFDNDGTRRLATRRPFRQGDGRFAKTSATPESDDECNTRERIRANQEMLMTNKRIRANQEMLMTNKRIRANQEMLMTNNNQHTIHSRL